MGHTSSELSKSSLISSIVELIRRSSTDYNPKWEEAISAAAKLEAKDSRAETVLTTILKNISMARKDSTPICQDTGTLIFYVDYPAGGKESYYIDAIKKAVIEATEKVYLRPNAVDLLSEKNSQNNIGDNAPQIYFHQWDKDSVRIRFMQKGGGSENCGIQYKLPDTTLGAGRDLKGVRKVVIDAILQAQGFGCAPGIIGIGIGGDRVASAKLAKEQLFRHYGERSPIPELAAFEKDLYTELNKLGIGPMGFGGKTTVLEVFTAVQHRHPATYYVTIAYCCWAYRTASLTIDKGEYIHAY